MKSLYRKIYNMTSPIFQYIYQPYTILVDAEDAELLINHFSSVRKQAYPRTAIRAVDLWFGKENGGAVSLHRFLMKALPGQVVDHINGNPLDNRKSNLRIVTAHQNSMNRGDTVGRKLPKGVYLRKANKFKPFIAGIRHCGQYINLGAYETVEQAANAYRTAADLLFNKHARTGVN
jgi:hypothetical protein